MHYTVCPICKIQVESCTCNEPFDLEAIPQPQLDGIARTISSRIKAYYQIPENQTKFEEWQKRRKTKKALVTQ